MTDKEDALVDIFRNSAFAVRQSGGPAYSLRVCIKNMEDTWGLMSKEQRVLATKGFWEISRGDWSPPLLLRG